jgi:hypothetical protein
VAEVLVQFTEPIVADGVAYMAKACGGPTADGLWQGWIEFTPVTGGRTIRSRRETTQPNKVDSIYWATGLTTVYLEGALERALKSREPVRRLGESVPAFDSPAPEPEVVRELAPVHAILDPFSVYRKGEDVLRRQLSALSSWHLVNIVRAYRLSDLPSPQLSALTAPSLIEVIVRGVRDGAMAEYGI